MNQLILRFPLWLRYLVTLVVGAGLFVALVLWVSHHANQADGNAANPNTPAEARAEASEDHALLVQQQAPQLAALRAGSSDRGGAVAAVSAFMDQQVSSGLIPGPVDGPARCRATGGDSARRVFSCQIYLGPASATLRYPFAAVVAPRARRVTYCQIITPTYPDRPVPLSPSCR